MFGRPIYTTLDHHKLDRASCWYFPKERLLYQNRRLYKKLQYSNDFWIEIGRRAVTSQGGGVERPKQILCFK